MAGWGFWVLVSVKTVFHLILLHFYDQYLAALYIVIDVKKWWRGAPFSVVGMNSILLYILHETLANQIPFCASCSSIHDKYVALIFG